jgi:hypothetical protein
MEKREKKKKKNKVYPLYFSKLKGEFELPILKDKEGNAVRGQRILYFGRSGSGKTSKCFEDIGKLPFGKKSPYYFLLILPSWSSNRAFEKNPDVRKYFEVPNWDHIPNLDKRGLHELKNSLAKVIIKEKRMPVLIMDDLGDNTAVKSVNSKQNIIQDLAKQAAHFSVTLVCLFQKFTQASTTIRENADVVILFKTVSDNELTNIHQAYFGHLDFNTFKEKYLDVFSEDFNTLTITIKPGGVFEYKKNDNEIIQF